MRHLIPLSLSPSLLPLKCFKAIRAGTDHLFFFFPRGCKNNIPGLLTLDQPQSERSVCDQACCLSHVSKQKRLVPITFCFFPRRCKNNIPVLLTLDHPQSERSACHQACCLSNASRQQGLVLIICFFLPAEMQKQHSCFDNVRSPTI